jgi:hypothetical protein
VLGVQEVLAVAFEIVTLMVVFFTQLAGAPVEVLLSPTWLVGFSVGAAVAGIDSSAIGEVGAAFLVERVMLLTMATSVDFGGADASRLDAGGVALLDSAGAEAGAVVGSLAGAELAGAESVGAESVGVELGSGVAVAVGLGSAAPCLTGTMFCCNDRSAWVTSKAASCWPTPEVPSQLPVYHLDPQVALPSPEHDLAAPTADALRYLVIWSFVKGATAAVLAMKRAR